MSSFGQRPVYILTVNLFLISFKLSYLLLSIVWHKAILNGGYVCFLQLLVLLHKCLCCIILHRFGDINNSNDTDTNTDGLPFQIRTGLLISGFSP